LWRWWRLGWASIWCLGRASILCVGRASVLRLGRTSVCLGRASVSHWLRRVGPSRRRYAGCVWGEGVTGSLDHEAVLERSGRHWGREWRCYSRRACVLYYWVDSRVIAPVAPACRARRSRAQRRWRRPVSHISRWQVQWCYCWRRLGFHVVHGSLDIRHQVVEA
jgi:hypothetical protein